MSFNYKTVCAMIGVVFFLVACSNKKANGSISSTNTNTTELMQHSSLNGKEDTEYDVTKSDDSSSEYSQYSDLNEENTIEYGEPASEISSAEFSYSMDFINQHYYIKDLIYNALLQIELDESTTRSAAGTYYTTFCRFAMDLNLQTIDIKSAEVVDMPEDLDSEVSMVDYAVCLIDHEGNRYIVVQSSPIYPLFIAFYYNSSLLASYYVIE